MAKQNKNQATRTTIDELNEKLSGAEQSVEANKKILIWIIAGIVVVIAAGLWAYYSRQSSVEESKEAVCAADAAAMEGDSTAVKLYQAVAADYSGKFANRASLEAAILLYSDKKYEEALKSLDEYRAEETLIGSLAKSLQGDCNVNLKKYDEAIKCYDKAVKAADGNKTLVPYALCKKASVLSAQGKHAEAAAVYEEVTKKYPNFVTTNGINVDKLLQSEKFRADKGK